MQVRRLDHVNIQTTQVKSMVAWYSDTLGLRSGPRPDFPFPGAWLYAGDDPVIHLVGHDGDPAVGSEAKLKLEHFALTATGRADFEAKLSDASVPHQRFTLDEIGVVQFHLCDPDGNRVHIDFEA
ncbi:glyoxalase [Pseudorhodobacter turbinis]|uniref:Glyoxalase n=1 Tax=Pseudorhodobacter turbinis TaxID=2500533 RepID=A0A4P8EE23_9RHOB|nr:VOC family protein [Pseudorhodobacter turbinis]QCO54863.1 glyoxalase [Pseudorhodobacter turbinis]